MSQQLQGAVPSSRTEMTSVHTAYSDRASTAGPQVMLRYLKHHWGLGVVAGLLVISLASVWQLSSSNQSVHEAVTVVLFRPSATTEAFEGRLSTAEVERELGAHAAVAGGSEVRTQVEEAVGLKLGDSRVVIDSAVDGLQFIAVASKAADAETLANAWAATYLDHARSDREANLEGSRQELEDSFDALRSERLEAIGPLRELQQILDDTVDPDRRTQLIREIDDNADSIGPDLDRIDSQLRSLGSDLAAVELAQLNDDDSLHVTRQATLTTSAASSGLRSWLAVVAVGFSIGVFAPLVRGHFDRRIRSGEQLEDLGLAVLATIPPMSERDDLEAEQVEGVIPEGEALRQFHLARTALGVRPHASRVAPAGGPSVAVVSAAPGEGRTTVARNLAAALMQSGEKATVVDGDDPSFDSRRHLSPTAESETDLAEECVLVFDSPALSASVGALDIASQTDWTILVTRSGRAIQDVERAVALVERAGGRVLGIVHIDAPLNARRGSRTARF